MTFELSPEWSVSHWDVLSGSLLLRKPLNLTGSSTSSAFSHDGRLLAVANDDSTITLCELATGERHCEHDPALGEVQYLEFSPDDRFLLLHRVRPQPGLLVLNLASRRLTAFPREHLRGSCWTPSQEVLTDRSGGELIRWNPATGQAKTVSLKQQRKSDFLSVSHDGSRVVALDVSQRKIHLWSLESQKLEREFAGHRGGQDRIAFSPDGKTLASAGADKTVKLWDVATGEELLTLEGYRGLVRDLRFSPDGKALAHAQRTGHNQPLEIRLWLAARDDGEPAASPPHPVPGERRP